MITEVEQAFKDERSGHPPDLPPENPRLRVDADV